jgi:hypothetical protein
MQATIDQPINKEFLYSKGFLMRKFGAKATERMH